MKNSMFSSHRTPPFGVLAALLLVQACTAGSGASQEVAAEKHHLTGRSGILQGNQVDYLKSSGRSLAATSLSLVEGEDVLTNQIAAGRGIVRGSWSSQNCSAQEGCVASQTRQTSVEQYGGQAQTMAYFGFPESIAAGECRDIYLTFPITATGVSEVNVLFDVDFGASARRPFSLSQRLSDYGVQGNGVRLGALLLVDGIAGFGSANDPISLDRVQIWVEPADGSRGSFGLDALVSTPCRFTERGESVSQTLFSATRQ